MPTKEKTLLSKEELSRYNRHIIMPEVGVAGQEKLKKAKVLVIGAGGLGCPVLQYLAAAGVGNIGVVDFDVVEESNLQRQTLFDVSNINQSKVQVAKRRLQEFNPHVEIFTYPLKLTSDNALDIIKEYDIVADGSDNFPTRYLVNDACILSGKPLVYGSIFRFEGQVSVFNYIDENGLTGPNYKDLFPEPPSPESVPNCAEAGVLGVLPGIIGSMQANEVIKIITEIGNSLSGRLFIFDALNFETRIIKITKNNNLNIKKLIDYDQFCGIKKHIAMDQNIVKEKTVKELKAMLDNKEDFQLIDVREPYEYDIVNLKAELVPLAEITKSNDKIATDKPVIIHCRSGSRSAAAVAELQSKFGFDNLYNLKGGVLAWAKEIDTSLPTY